MATTNDTKKGNFGTEEDLIKRVFGNHPCRPGAGYFLDLRRKGVLSFFRMGRAIFYDLDLAEEQLLEHSKGQERLIKDRPLVKKKGLEVKIVASADMFTR